MKLRLINLKKLAELNIESPEEKQQRLDKKLAQIKMTHQQALEMKHKMAVLQKHSMEYEKEIEKLYQVGECSKISKIDEQEKLLEEEKKRKEHASQL